MTANRIIALAGCLLATGTASANGGLLAYDGFDYAQGSKLAGLSGGTGWSAPWAYSSGASASGNVVEGLGYTDSNGRQLLTAGGAWTTDPGVFFARAERGTTATFGAAGSSVWMSFLVRQTTTPNSGVSYAMGTVGRGYTFGSGAMLGGLGDDDVRIAPFYSSSGNVVLPGAAPALSTSFIVLRVDFAAAGNDTMNLWLNPELDGEAGDADLTLSARNYASFFDGVTLAHGDNRTFTFDEIRVGSGFASVTPVPEPAAWMLLGCGLALLPALRRRHG
jgi:hypothetical protein